MLVSSELLGFSGRHGDNLQLYLLNYHILNLLICTYLLTIILSIPNTTFMRR